MSPELNIVIMAAGLGTRMRSNRAKVLHRLDGRPLINHVVETALSLDPSSICVVVGHQAERVEEAVRAEFDDENIHFVLQKQQLGTGDAVNASRQLYSDTDSTIVVLTGDAPIIKSETVQALIKQHRATAEAACTVLTVYMVDPTGYGRIIRDADGGFVEIVEQKDADEAQRQIEEVNPGFYCFESGKLFSALARLGNDNAQGEYYLTDVPGILKADGEMVGIAVAHDPRELEGINDRRQLATVERALRDKTVTRLMLETGVTFVDPSTAYVSPRAQIGRDTVISQHVTIEGRSVIGENCLIRPGVRLSNAIIGSNVEVLDNSVITDSEIGDNCSVGPMAHLRGHAIMEPEAKVGNFVEMKKSRLGRGSKASHLTYLGDATIGEETNIGAGTITCNYDGVRKNETHIGSKVKIGSDTMLVAPVKVGDGAMTAAGSVVTQDIEPRTLVAGVPAKVKKSLDPSGAAEPQVIDRPKRTSLSAEESLARMENFNERREQFIASIEKSQD